jgi:hypothetical protein
MKVKKHQPTVKLTANYERARSNTDWHLSACLWQGDPDQRIWLPDMTDESGYAYRANLHATGQIKPGTSTARGYTALEKVSELRERLIHAGIIKPKLGGDWENDDPILYAYGDRYVPARVS